MTYPKLWTKNFMAGTLINFLLLLNYYLLMVIMADYASAKYHASSAISGLTASLFVIGALFARFFSAQLMEGIGKKKLLILGTLLEVLSSAMYFFAAYLPFLFAIRFAHGLSYGMASTSISTIVTGLIPSERHGEGIGYFMLSITLGAAIGPFLGMFLIGHGGYSHIFITCAVTAVICFIASWLLQLPHTKTPSADSTFAKPESKSFTLSDIFEPKAVSISMVCAGIYFCYSSIISFLTPYTEEIQLQTAATFFFVVYSVVILITRPFTGRMFDTHGARFTMTPAFGSFFVGMLLLSGTHHGASLLTAAAFLGFGIGVIQSCGLAIAVQRSPAKRIGYANSTFYIFLDAGTGIGPFFLGFLIPVFGYRGMYLIMSAVIILFFLLFLRIIKKK